MDFSHFVDVAVIDEHVHFMHPQHMDGLLAVMETVPYARVNLLSFPSPEAINQNPAAVFLKAHSPRRVYISGGLDYTQVLADETWASENLATQVNVLKAIGFDGLKLLTKPTERKWVPIPMDAPAYERMWSVLEEVGMPVVWHVADPEEFWDAKLVPDWAYREGWFYGDGTFPLKEELYAEVDHVLERYPRLKLIFAHFYFLSADLPRASAFLDAHPSACFDLTPGLEMWNNFTRYYDAAREFFIRYQDRLIYGTDLFTTDDLTPEHHEGALSKAWLVRSLLEADDVFAPPQLLHDWLDPDLEGFHGLALPREVLEKIYYANFERMYGAFPAPLDREKALIELERMASVIDAQGGGKAVENQARQVAMALDDGGRG